MTEGNQNFGFDKNKPFLRGRDHLLSFPTVVPDAAVADWLAASSGTYIWFDEHPDIGGSDQTIKLQVDLDEITLTEIADGIRIDIPIADTLTDALDIRQYYHELKLTSGTGVEYSPFTGFIKLTAGVP